MFVMRFRGQTRVCHALQMILEFKFDWLPNGPRAMTYVLAYLFILVTSRTFELGQLAPNVHVIISGTSFREDVIQLSAQTWQLLYRQPTKLSRYNSRYSHFWQYSRWHCHRLPTSSKRPWAMAIMPSSSRTWLIPPGIGRSMLILQERQWRRWLGWGRMMWSWVSEPTYMKLWAVAYCRSRNSQTSDHRGPRCDPKGHRKHYMWQWLASLPWLVCNRPFVRETLSNSSHVARGYRGTTKRRHPRPRILRRSRFGWSCSQEYQSWGSSCRILPDCLRRVLLLQEEAFLPMWTHKRQHDSECDVRRPYRRHVWIFTFHRGIRGWTGGIRAGTVWRC